MNSEQKMREALDLLLEVHDTPCRFDHNGYCQEHYLDHAADGCRVQLAREALAAPAGEQVGLTKREIDGLLKECIDVLHCHQRNMQKDLLTRLRAARRVIATKRGGA